MHPTRLLTLLVALLPVCLWISPAEAQRRPDPPPRDTPQPLPTIVDDFEGFRDAYLRAGMPKIAVSGRIAGNVTDDASLARLISNTENFSRRVNSFLIGPSIRIASFDMAADARAADAARLEEEGLIEAARVVGRKHNSDWVLYLDLFKDREASPMVISYVLVSTETGEMIASNGPMTMRPQGATTLDDRGFIFYARSVANDVANRVMRRYPEGAAQNYEIRLIAPVSIDRIIDEFNIHAEGLAGMEMFFMEGEQRAGGTKVVEYIARFDGSLMAFRRTLTNLAEARFGLDVVVTDSSRSELEITMTPRYEPTLEEQLSGCAPRSVAAEATALAQQAYNNFDRPRIGIMVNQSNLDMLPAGDFAMGDIRLLFERDGVSHPGNDAVNVTRTMVTGKLQENFANLGLDIIDLDATRTRAMRDAMAEQFRNSDPMSVELVRLVAEYDNEFTIAIVCTTDIQARYGAMTLQAINRDGQVLGASTVSMHRSDESGRSMTENDLIERLACMGVGRIMVQMLNKFEAAQTVKINIRNIAGLTDLVETMKLFERRLSVCRNNTPLVLSARRASMNQSRSFGVGSFEVELAGNIEEFMASMNEALENDNLPFRLDATDLDNSTITLEVSG